jgi:hypothetical protein
MGQLADYSRRGKEYVFEAFQLATGEAFTHPYPARTGENWIDFLERVERWLPADIGRVYAVLDNLAAHRSSDVLLFNLAHPRWEFVFQPVAAAYLNLIEPRDQIAAAVERATAYWNSHRHPFVWGRRRRHRPRRPAGFATPPPVR